MTTNDDNTAPSVGDSQGSTPEVDAWGTPIGGVQGPTQAPPPQQQQAPMLQAEHPQSTTILVVGILGLLVCGVFSPFAWVMGSKARREVKANGGVETPVLTIGWALGIVGSIILALAVAAAALVAIVMLVAGSRFTEVVTVTEETRACSANGWEDNPDCAGYSYELNDRFDEQK